MKLCEMCEKARREEAFTHLSEYVSAQDVDETRWRGIPISEIQAEDLRRICTDAARRQNDCLGDGLYNRKEE